MPEGYMQIIVTSGGPDHGSVEIDREEPPQMEPGAAPVALRGNGGGGATAAAPAAGAAAVVAGARPYYINLAGEKSDLDVEEDEAA